MTSKVSNPFRSSDLCWEQCARLLLTLPLEDTLVLQETLTTILSNIREHPEDEKYARLKCSNAILQRKVLSKAGGREILHSLGFVEEMERPSGEKLLVYNTLPLRVKNTSPDALLRIEACLQWLTNTVHTCEVIVRKKREYLAMEKEKSSLADQDARFLERKGGNERKLGPAGAKEDGRSSLSQQRLQEKAALEEESNFVATTPSTPAEALIQLQLPTGKKVTGGFMLGDEFLQVYRFACSYFDNRREGVKLRLPHEKLPFDETQMDRTIEELVLFPRAKLIVQNTISLDNKFINAREQMEEAKKKADDDAAAKKKKVLDEKYKREEERKKTEEARIRTLQQFRDDRKRVADPANIKPDEPQDVLTAHRKTTIHSNNSNNA